MREFKQSFPKCVIRIEPGDNLRQLELLRSGQIDLAIMLAAPGQTDIEFVRLFEDELRFLVSPMHPWAQLPAVPREQVATETLILYNKRSATFRLVVDYFRDDGHRLGVVGRWLGEHATGPRDDCQ